MGAFNKNASADRAKRFVFGKLGESLKQRDPDRLLACIMADPDRYLFHFFTRDIFKMWDALEDDENKDKFKPGDLMDILERSEAFREIAVLMVEMDPLSKGSIVLGDPKGRQAKIYTKPEDLEALPFDYQAGEYEDQDDDLEG